MKNFLCLLVLLVACSSKPKKSEPEVQEQQEITHAVAYILSSSGQISGTLTLEKAEDGLMVTANVEGLKPNSLFGFHAHERGVCEGPDFESAGAHFNPTHQEHSGPNTLARHMGDFGNLRSDAEGSAFLEVLLPLSRTVDVNSFINRSAILHSKPDDLSTQPSGNSGSRLACGVFGWETIGD